jgi:hypothetical protein
VNGPRLVNVWTLKMSLDRMVSDADLEVLDYQVRVVVDRLISFAVVPDPTVWKRQGANLTVHTQGDAAPLLEIAQWALDNMDSPGPKGFTVERMQTDPLRLKEGWKGYDGN